MDAVTTFPNNNYVAEPTAEATVSQAVYEVVRGERDRAVDRAVAAERARDEAVALRNKAVNDLHNFKQQVRDRMIEEAEERGWCSEFDEILVEFGLEPRSHDYTVEFTITASTTVSVTARDEDEASEEASELLSSSISENRTYWIGGRDLYVTEITADNVEQD